MNRTDRLAALVMLLQSRRVITAAEMAAHFSLTERTVYRDLAALAEAGVPIVGEAGVGYSLRRGYHLPPVMFSPAEALALATGGLLAERMTDSSVAGSIRLALGKITAVLPPDLQDQVHRLRRAMLVHSVSPVNHPVPLSQLQSAMAEGRVLRIHYHGVNREGPAWREVEPLGLVYYLDHWHLIAWCRLRQDVRDFRADRLLAADLLSEKVSPRPGFELARHLRDCPEAGLCETAVIEIVPALLESLRRHWGPAIKAEEVTGHTVRVMLGFSTGSLPYLAAWLLGLGCKVTVIKPHRLRQTIVDMAMEAARHHQPERPLVPPLLT